VFSSIFKVFIDRLSDLLEEHKELGRQLRGKKFMFWVDLEHLIPMDLKSRSNKPVITWA
jgi:hypothetical protein